MKKTVVGILAHVDAGKTTLSESLLYLSGSIRKMGRVDHRDAFLDTDELERARGITIFSKQAVFTVGDTQFTLLDTPGHADFSAEMERTLQILDYAILVISGADGIQGHTQTLWRLLRVYNIPTFLFVNKMDQQGTDKNKLLADLKKRFGEGCIDFGEDKNSGVFSESLALCDEELLEHYLEHGNITKEHIISLIAERKTFPCYFGSALKLEGVEDFLAGMAQYIRHTDLPKDFGARVYKIARDEQGNRLTYLKVTGGTLYVKALLTGKIKNRRDTDEEDWEEKVNQIRIYSGVRFEAVNQADGGTVCAVTGLTMTYPGQGLGIEAASEQPFLEPVLTYRVELPIGYDAISMLGKLRLLEEEEPQLHVVWNEALGEIQVQIMGEVQIEILKSLILKRFGVLVEFGTGNVVYKETIANTVEGVGHFEPLRHYAEVHLLMEPGKSGSGMKFCTDCSEDLLDRNWQRLIYAHLREKEYKGVLTGASLTDIKITLIAGRAHQKHTEGGDFRQATYRAVRHGLMQANSVLLEPYYEFSLEVPAEMIGRAMSDIEKMHGSFKEPELLGELSVLTGYAPVMAMRGYQRTLLSYTKGQGRIFCNPMGYRPCFDWEEAIASIGYDAERDTENTADSVFCTQGSGTIVNWRQVADYMHVDSGLGLLGGKRENRSEPETPTGGYSGTLQEDKELEEIFKRTYVSKKTEAYTPKHRAAPSVMYQGKITTTWLRTEELDEYLLVDGYNIVFAWNELKELAKVSIDGARGRLVDIMCNYQGVKKCKLMIVFDAYKVTGFVGEVEQHDNIQVVYTKEAQTADQYIEKMAHTIGRKYRVTVATSDALEQLIVYGQGCRVISARELEEEVDRVNKQIRAELEKMKLSKNVVANHLSREQTENLKKGGMKTW